MDDSNRFSPETKQDLALVLDCTRGTMSEARENICILGQALRRGEMRIRELAREVERAKLRARQAESAAEEASDRERSLQQQLDAKTSQLEKQETEVTRLAGDLSSAVKEINRLRPKLSRLTAERDVLAEMAIDYDRIRRDKLDLARQLAKVAAAQAAQEKASAGLEERLKKAGSEDAVLRQALGTEKAGTAALKSQLAEAAGTVRTFEKERAEQDEALARFAEEKERLERELAEARQAIEAQNAQLAAAGGLREALQLDLDVSHSAITELRQVLVGSDEEDSHERTPQGQADVSA